MPEPLSIAVSIGRQAVRLFLAQRRKSAERDLPLAQLINLTTLDDYRRRGLDREIAAIVDTISERMEVYIQNEWRGLSENDRNAAMLAALDTFEACNLSDSSFFAIDADPITLARKLLSEARKKSIAKDLGESAEELYNKLLDESCILYCQLVVSLKPFVNRGIVELLARTSSLSYQVDLILQRLPIRSLDAPEGDTFDTEFTRRYLEYVASTQDEIELYGIDVNRYFPRATLSVAYISLSATTTYQHASTIKWSFTDDSRVQEVTGSSSSIESALAASRRMLVLGEAGSGKTTLLAWLAVTAARNSFTGSLTIWNGKIPFIIKLRQYVDMPLPTPEQFVGVIASTISDLKPRNWVHRILSGGKALLLVDGLDELPPSKRGDVRKWLRDLLKTYPDTDGVVTARPTAAKAEWLASESFSSVTLDRMGQGEVKALIRQWHVAIRGTGNLPCPEGDLPEYERTLLLKLEAAPHLQGLATSPLLCAMLCALNLDRRKALPPDRMAIYQAALSMLLERRDAERGVAAAEQAPALSFSDKIQLLQYLAWRLSLNSKTEVDKEQAIKRFEERLLMIRASGIDARSALNYLVSRSGVIREPVVGRIDFVHRTFQEYLTAKEAADNSDIGFLVDRAHLDTWQQTVIMAAGHANMTVKRELFSGLLARAQREARYSRRIRLLAAAALETAGALKPDIRQSVESCLADLIPPRRQSEASSLAMAGDAVFKYVPTHPRGMSDSAARAMVTTLAMIGGNEALGLLSNYACDERPRVIAKLIDVCPYFPPRGYANRVLAKIDFSGYPLTFVNDRATLACFRYLPSTKIHRLQLEDVTDLSADLRDAPPMTAIWAQGAFSDISSLENYSASLEDVTLWSTEQFSDLHVFERLPLLRELRIGPRQLSNISFLERIPQLTILWLSWLARTTNLAVLRTLTNLQTLRLASRSQLPPLEVLRHIPSLERLELYVTTSDALLSEVARDIPWLKSLSIVEPRKSILNNIDALTGLVHLERLEIESESFIDLGPVTRIPSLSQLSLRCPNATDLTPLSAARNLEHIRLAYDSPDSVNIDVLDGLSANITVADQYGRIRRRRK